MFSRHKCRLRVEGYVRTCLAKLELNVHTKHISEVVLCFNVQHKDYYDQESNLGSKTRALYNFFIPSPPSPAFPPSDHLNSAVCESWL